MYRNICVFVVVVVYLSIHLLTYPSIFLSIDLFLRKIENEAILRDFFNFWTWHHPKRSNSARLPLFELDTIQNEAILRDFLNFWTWQHPKRSNSAGLPQFLNLTTSKTKQFCETSFKHGKVSAELTASYQCVLRFFHSTCLQYCACREKLMPGHTKCCTCHAKSSEQTYRSDAPKRNSSQEISAPALLTALMNMTLVLRLPRKMHRFWKCYKSLMFCSLLARCTIPCACHAKRHLNAKKWSEHVGCF